MYKQLPSPHRASPHRTAPHRKRQSQDFLRLWQASVAALGDQGGRAGRGSSASAVAPSSPAAMLLDSLSIGHESVLRPAEEDFLQARGLILDGSTATYTRGMYILRNRCSVCMLSMYFIYLSFAFVLIGTRQPASRGEGGGAAFVADCFFFFSFQVCVSKKPTRLVWLLGGREFCVPPTLLSCLVLPLGWVVFSFFVWFCGLGLVGRCPPPVVVFFCANSRGLSFGWWGGFVYICCTCACDWMRGCGHPHWRRLDRRWPSLG